MDREKPRAAHTGASRAHGCWSACLRLLVASGAFGACSVACAQSDVAWASRVVFGVHEGEAVYEPGNGTPLTFGPFAPSNPLWQDPASVLGKPNTLDYDDLEGFGPVPGGFAGGPMRRVHLAWSAWQWGSNDPTQLGDRPGWLDGRRQNGVGLGPGSQLVVEFDEPIENNPQTGAGHRGIDLIVHGNASFTAAGAIARDADLRTVVLSGGVIAEPLEIAVAQDPGGPWFIADVQGDALFPTHPWAWAEGTWTGAEQDWGNPVDPGLALSDFEGLSVAEAIALYGSSAGGAGVDLDRLTDASGAPSSLPWARFVRFRDPAGNGGEICAVADVPGSPGCGIADLEPPFGVLDLSDIASFVGAFASGDPLADLAPPAGVLDLADITAFVDAFTRGCP